jgi:hypothetical protein
VGHRTKRSDKPSTPEECARRALAARMLAAEAARRERDRENDPAEWGINQDLAQLATANDIQAGTDVTKKLTRAKRIDVFGLLRATPCGPAGERKTVLNGDHIIAVDRFQRDLAIRHMTAGASGTGRATEAPSDFPLARIAAADRLVGFGPTDHFPLRAWGVLTRMRMDDPEHGNTYAKLLLDLSLPTITRGESLPNWRDVVQTVTGEHRDAEQAGWVRRACDGLVAGYGAIDRAGARRAA